MEVVLCMVKSEDFHEINVDGRIVPFRYIPGGVCGLEMCLNVEDKSFEEFKEFMGNIMEEALIPSLWQCVKGRDGNGD